MPVIPFIPAIISTVGGIVGGRMAQSAAQKRSAEEAPALAGAQQAAGTLAGQGRELFGTGADMIRGGQTTLGQPTSYYQKLLGGNRATMTQMVSAPREAISDVYRGAERNLEQGGVRGAARDVARSELGRQRAGQMSSLITGVQPGAAAALTGIGQGQVGAGAGIAGQGVGATGGGGNLFTNLLSQGAANRVYARGEGENFGSNWGGLIFDLLSGAAKSKTGGSRALPSRQTVPLSTSWMPSGG